MTSTPRPSRLLPWLVLLGSSAICMTVVLTLLFSRASAGHGMPDFSVYSDGPDGLAQTAAVLRRLGWQPVAVTRPIQQTHHRGLLIVVEPRKAGLQIGPAQPLGDADIDGLLDWVRNGNTLLFCCTQETRLYNRLGLSVQKPELDDATIRATPGAVGEYTARVESLGLEYTTAVHGRGAVPLWWLGRQPAAVVVRHGQGRVLIVPDPTLLTHRGLLRDDNAVFLYNVAALDAEDGRVYFDEYHHGIRAGGGYWNYLRYHNQHWVVLNVVVLAGLVWWSIGRRLGPATPVPVTKQADGVDYASSVARIYQQADVRPLIASVLARHFLEVVTTHLRLRRGAELREILTASRARHSDESAQALDNCLRHAQDIHPSAEQLLRTAQQWDSFVARHIRAQIA